MEPDEGTRHEGSRQSPGPEFRPSFPIFWPWLVPVGGLGACALRGKEQARHLAERETRPADVRRDRMPSPAEYGA
jgi:hypothetical protein